MRTASWAFLCCWGLHLLDHLHRGMSAPPDAVMYGGMVQGLMVLVAIALALRGRPGAPLLATLVGAASAVLVTYAHVLPEFWPGFQDSFSTGPRVNVTWFSWSTALLEIAAGLAFAWAGLRSSHSSAAEHRQRDEN